MVTLVDSAWAAGIIEGEGSFSLTKDKRSTYVATRIHVEMTDYDTIQRLNVLFPARVTGPYQWNVSRKPCWRWQMSKQKDVFDCLIHIMPFLSERRLTRASELFEHLELKLCK